MQNDFQRLYWEEHGECEPLAFGVFEACKLLIWTGAQFEAFEATMESAEQSVERRWKAENPRAAECPKRCNELQMRKPLQGWARTEFTEASLLERGFTLVGHNTIVAVEDGQGRLAIKVVYITHAGPAAETALRLAEYTLDGDKCKTPGAATQSEISKRGAKVSFGKMLMYGSTNHHGSNATRFSNGAVPTFAGVYNPRGKVDLHLLDLVAKHAEAMTDTERCVSPGYAAQRKALMERLDPLKEHRITPNVDATALSITSSYVVMPHDDSGKACEAIVFANRNGPLPPGHKWLFVAGGFLFALPEQKGGSALLLVKGDGVYHGTLPTSSTEPTISHGNLGTALASPKHTIDQLKRQLDEGRTTAASVGWEFTAFHMFAKRLPVWKCKCPECPFRGATYPEKIAHEEQYCRAASVEDASMSGDDRIK